MLELQRKAGNTAVSALLAARRASPTAPALADIDGALKQMRSGDPSIDTVEEGLKAAQSTGVTVDLEGEKPPASALEAAAPGFGPESVPATKAAPPTKAVPAASPLGTAAAKGAAGRGKPAKRPAKAVGAGPPKPAMKVEAPAAGRPAGAVEAASVGAEQLLQPPVPPTPVRPTDDPQFVAVTQDVTGAATATTAHPPAASKAKEAQQAAQAPADDAEAQAKAAKVDTMDAAQVGSFDEKAFIAAVKKAIEAKSPKTLEEADEFKKTGKAKQIKGEVEGLVTQGKEGQAKDIAGATEAAPDQSKAVPKPVTPMPTEQAARPHAIASAGAVPKPAPAEQLNLAAGKHQVDQQLAEADVTDKQLAESKEPEFEQALADKKAAAHHADAAPAEYRKQEQQTIAQGRADTTAQTAEALAGMQSSKAAAIAGLTADKDATKSQDEQKRAEVSKRVQGIYAATEADVRQILDGIDAKVDKAFTAGEKSARELFEGYVAVRMWAYKKDRYGGVLGPLRWAKDKLLGMPAKVNEFYEAGRQLYLRQMDAVISRVASIIGADLSRAKKRIAKGRADIAAYVRSLPADLQKVGSQASAAIDDRFATLEGDVSAKRDTLIDTLASKYVESRKGLDERIEALQAENKGLVEKVVGKIKGVIATIRELGAMLRKAFARAAGVVGEILKAPGKFLDNLIAGVKGGITRFSDNILDHLRKGLLGWLFGALARGGVELPKSFDLKGVIGLLGSIFGLTWTAIRQRVVRRIGEKAMGAVEKGVDIFRLMASEGIGGVWQMVVEKIGDIKEMIVEQAQEFVVTQIIKAGITWLISLLNPVAAFIKACKLIVDIVMFFVNNARRIAQFVATILDSVVDMVRGNIGGVIAKIEGALSQMVTIIIGFLASVLGLSGIGEKIRAIVKALQKPVNRALDFIIAKGLKLAGPVIRGIKGISGRVKSKVTAGKAWAKGKAQVGMDRLRAIRESVLRVAFRGTFDAKGGQHTVYTQVKSPGLVLVASKTPQIVDEAIATPAMRALRRRFAEINTERSSIAQQIQRTSDMPRLASLQKKHEQLRDDARRVFAALVSETAKLWLSTTGMEGKVKKRPVPNRIGEVRTYGRQRGSQRKEHPLFWLEAEHVIPFGVGKRLWEALSLPVPARSEPEDKAQTTIMIYYRAARMKTYPDLARIDQVKAAMLGAKVKQETARLRTTGAVGLEDPVAKEALAFSLSALEAVRADAADRTATAVEAESTMKPSHVQETNGERRGEKQPRPTKAEIDNASKQQQREIRHFLEQSSREIATREFKLSDMNATTLQRFYGVGPQLAHRISDYVHEVGLSDLDDLRNVQGVTQPLIDRLRDGGVQP